MNPLQRSLKELRRQGWMAEKVEQAWNPYSKVRKDLFGIGDILAVRGEACPSWGRFGDFALVNACATGTIAAHERKFRNSENAVKWLAAGGRIIIHGWSKKGPRGKRKVWTLTEREIAAL